MSTTTTINVDSINQEYAESAYHESLEATPFGRAENVSLQGAGKDSVIVERNDDLARAQTITYTLIQELSDDGTGTDSLRNVGEEPIPNKATKIHPVWSRHATEVKKDQERVSAVTLYPEQRRTLQNWNNKKHIDAAVHSLAAIGNDENQINEGAGIGRTKTWYNRTITPRGGSAINLNTTDGERDAFVTANARRLFFGAENAGLVAGDWSASLAAIAAGDIMNYGIANDMVYQASDEDWTAQQYRIPPLMEPNFGEEMYMVFHTTSSFLNLKRDSDVQAFHKEAVAHDGLKGSPFVRGGDIVFGQAIHRRVQRLDKLIEPSLAGAGAAGIDLTCAFVTGKMAICLGYGQATRFTTDNVTDFDFENPIGIESNYAYEKAMFGAEQYGVLPVFTAKV